MAAGQAAALFQGGREHRAGLGLWGDRGDHLAEGPIGVIVGGAESGLFTDVLQILTTVETPEKDLEQRIAAATRVIGVGEQFDDRFGAVDQRIEVGPVSTSGAQRGDVAAHLIEHRGLARQDAGLLKVLVADIPSFITKVGEAQLRGDDEIVESRAQFQGGRGNQTLWVEAQAIQHRGEQRLVRRRHLLGVEDPERGTLESNRALETVDSIMRQGTLQPVPERGRQPLGFEVEGPQILVEILFRVARLHVAGVVDRTVARKRVDVAEGTEHGETGGDDLGIMLIDLFMRREQSSRQVTHHSRLSIVAEDGPADCVEKLQAAFTTAQLDAALGSDPIEIDAFAGRRG